MVRGRGFNWLDPYRFFSKKDTSKSLGPLRSNFSTHLMRTCVGLTHISKQGIHRHQTPARYRNAASGSRLKIQPSTLWHIAIRPNMTSSIKPDVHSVSQRRQRRTEPRSQGICIKYFVKIGPAVPEICSRIDKQTHRQTDHNTPLPIYRAQ